MQCLFIIVKLCLPIGTSPTPSGDNQSQSQQQQTTDSNNSTTPTSLLPPPLQNVEQFGSFLGEEIVANWRRTLEQRPPMICQQQPLSLPPPTTPSPALTHAGSEPKAASTTPSDTPSNGTPIPHDKTPPEDNNNHLQVLNFLRDDALKSPYRFEERTFRFADDISGGIPGAMVGRLGESLIPKGDPMEARLQEMLRYNMDKYATQNLDTLHIARRVRELLSIHNIGQRLFAKYVLGLSQGTVSELLSKPKPWDKLTEKGRDSYRKMHAWACDENAVMLLKSLIPKKGKLKSLCIFLLLFNFSMLLLT